MVFGDGQPVVITCMNWRTGETTNTLVDAAGHPSLSHIPDLSPHIRFDSRDSRDSELILIDDWVGIFQICEGGSVRYIMIPTDYQSKTIPSGEDGGLPPFRSNPEGTVAVGCHPPTRSVVMRIDGGAAVYPTCLHGPKQLRVMIQESPWTDVVIGMLTLDFTRFCSDVARDEIRRRAGFHKLEYLHHEMASVTWPPGSFSPTVGRSGWALGCIRDVEENCPCVELYPLPQEAYNTRLGTPSRVCLPPMVRRESINDLLTLEDAAGVVCLEDSDQRFWFVRIRGTNVVKDNGLLVPLEGVVGLHGAE
ncbi:hypothetical protein FRB91_004820 [Serendipita sp. 411]|nr:hypothetical protein FRB91_004820 [Serendipita sp. 411]